MHGYEIPERVQVKVTGFPSELVALTEIVRWALGKSGKPDCGTVAGAVAENAVITFTGGGGGGGGGSTGVGPQAIANAAIRPQMRGEIGRIVTSKSCRKSGRGIAPFQSYLTPKFS
ncbi:MAG: hypothetical protein AAB500_00290 [Patescibacteria group bacterium]